MNDGGAGRNVIVMRALSGVGWVKTVNLQTAYFMQRLESDGLGNWNGRVGD
jgi:hypothetical protein